MVQAKHAAEEEEGAATRAADEATTATGDGEGTAFEGKSEVDGFKGSGAGAKQSQEDVEGKEEPLAHVERATTGSLKEGQKDLNTDLTGGGGTCETMEDTGVAPTGLTAGGGSVSGGGTTYQDGEEESYIVLGELSAESLTTADSSSLVSSIRLPPGCRIEVEFPTEFHSFMEVDRVRVASKGEIRSALAKLKAYAEQLNKSLDFSAINLAQNATNLYWNLSRFDRGGCVEAALQSLCPSCGLRLKRRRACSSSASAGDEKQGKRGKGGLTVSRDQRRQNEADAFYDFMAAEFSKRSQRLKQRKEELGETLKENKKIRLPATVDGGDVALINAFIDAETGLIKRPFSLASASQRRILYIHCLRNNFHANVRLSRLPGKGRAVLAADVIRKDDFVLEYKGELCSEREARERDIRYDRSKSFMFYFKYKERQMSIDATEERLEFGPARLINHSRKNPNLKPKAEALDGDSNDLRLFFVALRDIDEGEELLVDYGERDPEALKQNPWLNE
ncbi:set domain-containing protein [Cyclospora cayetanensis]|uniref:Set domain-containing protein n=1 Tax=Cyclospora cayetanensis TaxID=88456 RepID=A0A1D3D404_9EIME|nr:set domain-containing protein [Cyclospora cayetanensis]